MSGTDGSAGQRLERALAAFVQHRLTPGGSDAELLAGNADLRDLLEPMLAGEEPGPEASEEAATRRLGDFDVGREIGRGGMGVVYEARQRSLDRRVALKVLPADFALHPERVARFKREASIAGKLQHPGIVKVFAVGEEAGTCFFAMELVDGVSLDRSGQQPGESKRGIRPTIELVLQVADALDHAHRAGVVHRDVKPSNILVRPDGTAVLTDFGLSREEDLPSLSRSGSLAGTPSYMAPEQAAGRGASGPATDVWALGVTLYELVTGRRPFDADTTQAVLQQILTREPTDPQRLAPEVSADLAAIVLKALEKEPMRRYGSAAELAADLRAFLAYRPVSARRPTPAGRLVRWARRRPVEASFAAAMLLAVPLITGLLGYVLANRETTRAGAERLRTERADDAIADGFASMHAGAHAEALQSFRTALALEGDRVEAMAGEALVLARSGRMDESLAVLAGYEARAGASPSLQRVRVEALRAAGRQEEADRLTAAITDRLDPIDLMLRAEYLLRRFEKTENRAEGAQAQRWLEAAIVLSPRPGKFLLYMHGTAARCAGDRASMAAAIEALRRRWPGDARVSWQIGRILHKDDPKLAIAELEKLRAAGDRTQGVAVALGHARLQAGDVRGALTILREAAAAYPDSAAVLSNLAVALYQRNRWQEALPYLERAIALEPREPAHRVNLASVLIHLGRVAEGEAAARQAIAIDADVPAAWVVLASVLLRRQENDQAEAALRRALALNPDDLYAHFHMGFVLGRRGDWDAAVAEIEKAIAQRPDAVHLLAGLQRDYERSGQRTAKADAFFARASGEVGEESGKAK